MIFKIIQRPFIQIATFDHICMYKLRIIDIEQILPKMGIMLKENEVSVIVREM